MSFKYLKYCVCLKSLSQIMAHYSTCVLAIKTCFKTCLPGVNMLQITLLRGYIHPNEQFIAFIP